MGVKSNADMFASRGNPWETTELEARRTASDKARLKQHLRQAKFTEARFIGYLRDKLADAGKPQPVRVDKQRLAEEKKKERPPMSSRSPSRNALSVALAKANRLAALDKQLRANETVNATLSKYHKDYGHFTKKSVILSEAEKAEIWETAQNRCITFLTYIILSHVGQNKGA
jgi:hypothetical protein